MSTLKAENIKLAVQERYGSKAQSASACCSAGEIIIPPILYSASELKEVPMEAVAASAGCGNPVALAELRLGERVLDLGSGGGIDCFLAAHQVGPEGMALGVDMTMDMVSLARGNAIKVGVQNVEFFLGEIERLPLGDDQVDVIISNCVVCLSPNKDAVFSEALRVLAPGGRIHLSDMMALTPEGPARTDPEAWASCIAGAEDREVYLGRLRGAGFVDIAITEEKVRFDDNGVPQNVASVKVVARKR
jgi:SAM-dependent methyltransferase